MDIPSRYTSVVKRREGYILCPRCNSVCSASVCTGAFLLAECGLLNQRRATTHWTAIEMMHQRYPAVEMLAHTRIVDEGHIITSAGVSAGIDMSLHVISRLFGEPVAAQTARYMEYERRMV